MLLAGMLLLPRAAAAAERLEARYPEGALWQGTTLYYAEMGADRVSRWDGNRTSRFWRRRGCGPTAIAPYRNGDFLVLCHLEGAAVHVSGSGRTRQVYRTDTEGRPLIDPNDATEDGAGGVFFSDSGRFATNAPATGRVMHIDAEGRIETILSGLTYANGVYFDQARGQLYVSEHLARQVLRLGTGTDGAVTEKAVFADLDRLGLTPDRPCNKSGPDGLEIGPDGRLWVCEYGQGRVLVLNPDGSLDGTIAVDTPYLTTIGFSADGRMALAGAYDNRTPPFEGAVFIEQTAESLRRE